MSGKTDSKFQEHKELKEFDMEILKEILAVKDKYGYKFY